MPVNAETIQEAKSAGYSPDEIRSFITTAPEYSTATRAGYDDKEIFQHLGFDGATGDWRQKAGTEGKKVSDLEREFIAKEGSLMTRARHGKTDLVLDQLYDIPRTVAEIGTATANTVNLGARGLAAGLTGNRDYVRNFTPMESPMGESNLSRYVINPVATGATGLAEQGANRAGLPEGAGALAVETVGNILPAFGLKSLAGVATKGARGLASVPAKVADLAVEKLAPASWEPSGTVTKKAAPSPVDSTQKRLNRIQEKAPQVVENRLTNSAENLTPPERASADPAIRAENVDKLKTGLDNLEQLANEGVIHEHNARGAVVLDSSGAPKPYEVGKGGTVAAVKPVLQALNEVWNEVKGVLSRATENKAFISTDNVSGIEKFQGRVITPVELQAEISALNELLYKTKNGVLSLEDTAKRNILKQSVGKMNTLLDESVAKVMEDGTPSTQELHKQWGGVRQLADSILNGAERKLGGGSAAAVTDIPAHGGLTYKTVGTASRLAKKLFHNPDSAFDTLIRARRAQGNTVRQRFADPLQDMPRQPQVYDPSTGKMIEAAGQGIATSGLGETVVPEANRPQTSGAPRGPLTQPEPRIGTYTGNAADTSAPGSRTMPARPDMPPAPVPF